MTDWAHNLAVKIGLRLDLTYEQAMQLEADLKPAIAAIKAEAYDDGVVDQKLATLDAVTATLDALAAQVTNYIRTTEKAWYGVDEKSIDAEDALAAVLALIAEARR